MGRFSFPPEWMQSRLEEASVLPSLISTGHYYRLQPLPVFLFIQRASLWPRTKIDFPIARATKANKRQTKNDEEMIIKNSSCWNWIAFCSKWTEWPGGRMSEWNVGTGSWKNEIRPPTGWFFNGHNTRDITNQLRTMKVSYCCAGLDQVIKCSKPNADGTFTIPPVHIKGSSSQCLRTMTWINEILLVVHANQGVK